MDEAALEHLTFTNGDIRLHAVAAGPSDGPVLLLLHGFPEFWYGWRHQIWPLADAGYRVVAPDQRGYNLSSKPRSVASYQLTELVSDVIAIIDQLGRDRVCLAGHDWGALVAWCVGLAHPERLHRLAILNVPHPSVARHNVLTNPRQWLKSWYVLFFQLPALPEAIFSRNNYASGRNSMIRSSRPGTFSPEDLAKHVEAWSQPGALTAMINWYRALLRHPHPIEDPRLRVPTHILWGKKDKFLCVEEAEESLAYCPRGELTYFPDATHWVQHEEWPTLNQLMIDWFVT